MCCVPLHHDPGGASQAAIFLSTPAFAVPRVQMARPSSLPVSFTKHADPYHVHPGAQPTPNRT